MAPVSSCFAFMLFIWLINLRCYLFYKLACQTNCRYYYVVEGADRYVYHAF